MTEKTDSLRIDKWLWCARFYKTRNLAAEAVKSGKIKINGDKAKPAKTVSVNDQLRIRKNAFQYDIIVKDIPKARLAAAKAVLLYEESEESIANREMVNTQLKADAALFPKSHGRPSKRDRRELMKFKQRD